MSVCPPKYLIAKTVVTTHQLKKIVWRGIEAPFPCGAQNPQNIFTRSGVHEKTLEGMNKSQTFKNVIGLCVIKPGACLRRRL